MCQLGVTEGKLANIVLELARSNICHFGQKLAQKSAGAMFQLG
ncbi:Protein CBG27837 [Caenorhabditis briggsae]|uniref:Protein CBG27837 n=1 Tax=Caenorhabditis briggsae TaxID=6238 RepID=B6IKB9_CAEBR|nr:Protein CBG27837 [Caenorhabditis briggsae]CAS00349.1 Protein CBG27837 [Caenorhabditis briggsae]